MIDLEQFQASRTVITPEKYAERMGLDPDDIDDGIADVAVAFEYIDGLVLPMSADGWVEVALERTNNTYKSLDQAEVILLAWANHNVFV